MNKQTDLRAFEPGACLLTPEDFESAARAIRLGAFRTHHLSLGAAMVIARGTARSTCQLADSVLQLLVASGGDL